MTRRSPSVHIVSPGMRYPRTPAWRRRRSTQASKDIFTSTPTERARRYILILVSTSYSPVVLLLRRQLARRYTAAALFIAGCHVTVRMENQQHIAASTPRCYLKSQQAGGGSRRRSSMLHDSRPIDRHTRGEMCRTLARRLYHSC